MDDILLENSDHLLQEDSFFILLETQAGGGSVDYLSYPGTYAGIGKRYSGYRI